MQEEIKIPQFNPKQKYLLSKPRPMFVEALIRIAIKLYKNESCPQSSKCMK